MSFVQIFLFGVVIFLAAGCVALYLKVLELHKRSTTLQRSVDRSEAITDELKAGVVGLDESIESLRKHLMRIKPK